MMRRLFLALALPAAGGAADAADPQPAPKWQAGLSGGMFDREGDAAHPFGSLFVSRRLGRGYVRATLTGFESAVAQVDVVLPSTYALATLSGGATFGRWFVDGYATAGRQHYRATRTPLGRRAVTAFGDSNVWGVGGDVGRLFYLGSHWALTPSVAINYIHSRALREQPGFAGPQQFETVEQGTTGSAALRLDRFFGADRQHDVGLTLLRVATSNQAAALGSGTRGQSARSRDGWSEAELSAAWALSRSLRLDMAVRQSLGTSSGDTTTASAGLRVFF